MAKFLSDPLLPVVVKSEDELLSHINAAKINPSEVISDSNQNGKSFETNEDDNEFEGFDPEPELSDDCLPDGCQLNHHSEEETSPEKPEKEIPVKRKPGRPKKNSVTLAKSKEPGRKRGRPKSVDPSPKKEVTSTSLIPLLEIRQPRKCKRSVPWGENSSDVDSLTSVKSPPVENEVPVPRKRGRPKKVTVLSLHSSSDTDNTLRTVPQSQPKLTRKYAKKVYAVKRPLMFRSSTLGLANDSARAKKLRQMRLRQNFSNLEENDLRKTEDQKIDIRKGKLTENVDLPDNDRMHREPVSQHPKAFFSSACKFMFSMGWSAGGRGSFSVRHDRKLFVVGDDIDKGNVDFSQATCYPDPCTGYKLKSVQENHFTLVHIHKLKKAGVVVFSQSENAVLASLVYLGNEFRITHQEMIGGIRYSPQHSLCKYGQMLSVPVVEYSSSTNEMAKRIGFAIDMHPDTNAVLVRRHGVYVWGETWPETKAQSERYHYLFQLAFKLKQIGIEPDREPRDEFGIGSS